MNVYSYMYYQHALAEAITLRRQSVKKWTLRQLAEAVGIQASYLTNVLKRRAEFNSDQLYAVCEHLGFRPAERRYLLLLLEYQRSTLLERKRELKVEIDEVRREHLRSEAHLSAKPVEGPPAVVADYYLDPFAQLVHVHLNLGPDTSQLCATLGISQAHLEQILAMLIRIGYIVKDGPGYRVVTKNKHLPKDNPLCGPHQALMRMKSIDQMQRLTNDEKYSFSGTFTGTEETRLEIQESFLAYLKKVDSIVRPAEAQKVFQINFDLFPWRV